jgi:hypothetical protein
MRICHTLSLPFHGSRRFLGRAGWREWREGLIEGRCAQGFGISVTVWCKLEAEACICAEHEVAINGVVVGGGDYRS